MVLAEGGAQAQAGAAAQSPSGFHLVLMFCGLAASSAEGGHCHVAERRRRRDRSEAWGPAWVLQPTSLAHQPRIPPAGASVSQGAQEPPRGAARSCHTAPFPVLKDTGSQQGSAQEVEGWSWVGRVWMRPASEQPWVRTHSGGLLFPGASVPVCPALRVVLEGRCPSLPW